MDDWKYGTLTHERTPAGVNLRGPPYPTERRYLVTEHTPPFERLQPALLINLDELKFQVGTDMEALERRIGSEAVAPMLGAMRDLIQQVDTQASISDRLIKTIRQITEANEKMAKELREVHVLIWELDIELRQAKIMPKKVKASKTPKTPQVPDIQDGVILDWDTPALRFKQVNDFLPEMYDVEAPRDQWKWIPNFHIMGMYETWLIRHPDEKMRFPTMKHLSKSLNRSMYAVKGSNKVRVNRPSDGTTAPHWGWYLPPVR